MNGVHHPYTRQKFNNLSLAAKVTILRFRRAVDSAISKRRQKSIFYHL